MQMDRASSLYAFHAPLGTIIPGVHFSKAERKLVLSYSKVKWTFLVVVNDTTSSFLQQSKMEGKIKRQWRLTLAE